MNDVDEVELNNNTMCVEDNDEKGELREKVIF
jgi:hypothetical protein